MVKFYGTVGFSRMVKVSPGVFQEEFVEYPYYGDLKQDLRKLQATDNLNGTVILQNLVEIMADKYAYENYHNIRYVSFDGVRWKVGYVEVRSPRLWLRFGEVYNGPIAPGAAEPPGGDPGE